MSQSILGLDLGRRSVKAVVLETTFKGYEAVRFAEAILAPDDGETPWTARMGEAVGRLVSENDLAHDVTVTALPGDRVTTRVITLPFTRAREIDLVLGPELEDQLPFSDLDEVVFDYQILATGDDGARLMVAVADREFLAEFLEALQAGGVDPRVVTVGGFAKADLLRHMAIAEDGPLLVADMGHEATTLTVVRHGKPVMWRTVLRGGRRVDEALAGVDREDGHAASAAIGRALGPLVGDMKQTLLSAAGVTGEDVRAIYLCGGASRLGGLDAYLTGQCGVDVVLLEASRAAFNTLPDAAALDAAVPEALGLALRALPGQPDEVNFRKGELAFKGEYQYLRGKVVGVALGMLALLVSLGGLAYASYHAMRAEEVQLLADLQGQTQAIFGRPYTDFHAAAAAVSRKGAAQKNPIPTRDAYHLLYDTSVKVGDDLVVDLDLFEVDLDRERAEIRGRTESATAVQTIVGRLGKVDCFGRVETERNERGTDDKQVFHLSVKLGGC